MRSYRCGTAALVQFGPLNINLSETNVVAVRTGQRRVHLPAALAMEYPGGYELGRVEVGSAPRLQGNKYGQQIRPGFREVIRAAQASPGLFVLPETHLHLRTRKPDSCF